MRPGVPCPSAREAGTSAPQGAGGGYTSRLNSAAPPPVRLATMLKPRHRSGEDQLQSGQPGSLPQPAQPPGSELRHEVKPLFTIHAHEGGERPAPSLRSTVSLRGKAGGSRR
jgi:hypothetical protein